MMSQKETIKKLWQLFSDQKWDESKELFHPNFHAIWPQSKEKFTSAHNYIEMNREYPGHHIAQIRHLIEEDNSVVCTAFISADTGQTAYATSYFEFQNGLIVKVTEYWGSEYPAPESRKKYAQSLDDE